MQEVEPEQKEEVRKRHPGKDKFASHVRRQAQYHREDREERPIVGDVRVKRSLLVTLLRDTDRPVDIGR